MNRNSKLGSFTLLELLLVITIAALIISIGLPAFIDINRGAAAKSANNIVQANLKEAQQQAIITRQRVALYLVTQVINNDNRWVSPNMVNRSFFIYLADTPGIAKTENFLTSVQTLPAPMMFDFTGSNLPTVQLVDVNSGQVQFIARGFRFSPTGGVLAEDAQLVSAAGNRYDIVITEGLAGAGGSYTPKTSGTVIKYTNSVNTFTGRIYRP